MKRMIWIVAVFIVMSMQGVQGVTLDSGECITSNNVTYCAVVCVPVNKTTCNSFIEEGIENRTEYLEENCMQMENLFNAVKYARDNITNTINSTYANLGPGFLDDLAYYKNEYLEKESLYQECSNDLVKFSVNACKSNITSLQEDLDRYKGWYNEISREREGAEPKENLPACIYQMEIAQNQMWYGWFGGILAGAGLMWFFKVRKKVSHVDKTREGIYTEGEAPRTSREEEKAMVDFAKETMRLRKEREEMEKVRKK